MELIISVTETNWFLTSKVLIGILLEIRAETIWESNRWIESRSYQIGFKKIGHWIVGFMKMLTALSFVKIFKINRVDCSKKINTAENLT